MTYVVYYARPLTSSNNKAKEIPNVDNLSNRPRTRLWPDPEFGTEYSLISKGTFLITCFLIASMAVFPSSFFIWQLGLVVLWSLILGFAGLLDSKYNHATDRAFDFHVRGYLVLAITLWMAEFSYAYWQNPLLNGLSIFQSLFVFCIGWIANIFVINKFTYNEKLFVLPIFLLTCVLGLITSAIYGLSTKGATSWTVVLFAVGVISYLFQTILARIDKWNVETANQTSHL